MCQFGVKFPSLDFKYWSPNGLSKIGRLVGRPLMVDQNTKRKVDLQFARILVEVEFDAQLPDTILFRNEKGQLIEQRVSYDWKPALYIYCHAYGHAKEVCRKKNKPATQHDKVAFTIEIVQKKK